MTAAGRSVTTRFPLPPRSMPPTEDPRPAPPPSGDDAERAPAKRVRRETLIQEAKAGSQSARGELFEQMSPALQGYLRRKVGQRLGRAVSISDIAQESFLRSFDELGRLERGAGMDDFKGLLYQHAQWLLGKAARKNRDFLGESVVGSPLPATLRDRQASMTTGEVTRADRRGWLQRQIERLGPEDAQILQMRGRGMSFDEIATELDLQVATAQKRCLRASRRLRTLLEGKSSEG